MDNYNLSNSLLSGHIVDSGKHHSWLTDEENRRATFSGRSATVSTSEQVQRQQLPSTGDEQIPEQRVLANFDISSASTTSAAATTVDEPEDPFAALAAYAARAAYHYQILTFNGDTGQPLNSNLGLFGNINTSSETVLAELEGNDVVERPEQSQGKSDGQGIIIPEITIPDTVSDKRSGKWHAPEPRYVVIGDLPESVINESSRLPDRLTGKRQKLDSTKSEIAPLPEGLVTRSQSVTKPERSAISEQDTDQNPNETLKECVKKETQKWILISEDGLGGKQYLCSYPYCDHAATTLGHLKSHIFSHCVTKPERSAISEQDMDTDQNPNETLKERVERETQRWMVISEDGQGGKQFRCSFPYCGHAAIAPSNLKTHIFSHIRISEYKCTYPECGDNLYFRNNCNLQRHVQSCHTYEKRYNCKICKNRFGRLDNYKRHVRNVHKMSL